MYRLWIGLFFLFCIIMLIATYNKTGDHKLNPMWGVFAGISGMSLLVSFGGGARRS